MLAQVIISPGMYPFHFLESEGEPVFYIRGCICIMRKLDMVVKTVISRTESKCLVPKHSGFLPFGKPLQFGAGLNEKLHFHLLEFPHPENELSGNYLIAECLSYLGNSERYFHPSGFLDIKEVDKDTLGSFRPQIDLARSFEGGTHLGREHQVELSDFCPVTATGYRADYFVVNNYLSEFSKVRVVKGFGEPGIQFVDFGLVCQYPLVGLPEFCLVEGFPESFPCLFNLF